jgi:ribosomal protein S12 methylthiotransferase
MAAQIPDDVKKARYAAVMEVQQEIAAEQQAAWIGRRVEVLVEGASEESEHLLAGRTSQQAPEIDGVIYLNEIAIPGQEDAAVYPGEIVTAEVTDASAYDLVARVIAPDERPRPAPKARKASPPPAKSGLRVLS